jgi:hypothetical protein
MPGPEEPSRDPVVVFETNEAFALAALKGLLEDAAISYFIVGEIATLLTDIDPMLRKWVQVQVPADRETEVRTLLKQLQQ